VTNPAYLQPVDDGLPMRSGGDYARAKLQVVQEYLNMAMTAVKTKPWRTSFYIDLQSGPGKNNLDGKIELGSPLIALNCPVPFENYRFNEGDPVNAAALKQRITESPLQGRVKILEQDVNQAVDEVCREIFNIDSVHLEGVYSSFNIAFLDPEGLELEWATVEKLANMRRMDLIINFSTSGINRNYRREDSDRIDRFFGTAEWRKRTPENASASIKRRIWIDFYLERLASLGYVNQLDDNAEIVAKNSNNVQLYTIICASKHPLGLDLWKKAVKQVRKSGQLPLF
jgi:three-Cys-motif partner protein